MQHLFPPRPGAHQSQPALFGPLFFAILLAAFVAFAAILLYCDFDLGPSLIGAAALALPSSFAGYVGAMAVVLREPPSRPASGHVGRTLDTIETVVVLTSGIHPVGVRTAVNVVATLVDPREDDIISLNIRSADERQAKGDG